MLDCYSLVQVLLFSAIDPVDLTSHLIFVQIGPTDSSSFYAQNKPQTLQNLFQVVLNNPINKNIAPE